MRQLMTYLTISAGLIATPSIVSAQQAFAGTAAAQHSGKCMEVPAASTSNDIQLVQQTCTGKPEQTFLFEPVAVGQIFRVKTTHSNKCLDIRGASLDDGAALIQQDCDGSRLSQQFRLEGLGRDLRFRLKNMNSGKCVDVSGVSTRDGRPVHQWGCQALTSTQRNQNWQIPAASAAGFGNGIAITASQKEAARFLIQASYGPTEAEINRVASIGVAGWIDDQFAKPASSHLAMHQQIHVELSPMLTNDEDKQCIFSWPCNLTRHDTWWHIAVYGQDQLRQRMAFALSQFFVISDSSVDYSQYSISDFYDVLADNAFGNFRTLMEQVTLHPAMGRYLGMLQNEKADPSRNTEPDENFARELMQLFSIGLVELNIDGTPKLDAQGNAISTYDNADITNYARIFTGWNFQNAQKWWHWEKDVGMAGLLNPMKPWENYHDTGAKVLINNTTIPGGNAAVDTTAALDSLFNHPNVGPFLARHLIQRFVTSNPSPNYIRRVAEKFNNNGAGIRGDMKAVIRAILLDDEARKPAEDKQYTYGKLKEPVLRMSALLRAFNAQGARIVNTAGQQTRPLLRNRGYGTDFAQTVMSSPSVFNFYRPNYQHSGVIRRSSLYSPEFQILNEATSVSTTNHFLYRLNRSDKDDPDNKLTSTDPILYTADLRMDYSKEKALANTPEALVDRINLLLMAGQMSELMRNVLIDAMYKIPMNKNGDDRVEDLVFLIATSPQFSVQR